MARPRTVADDVVLDAAGALMASAGPAGFTLARVAEAAGLSPATLVQRFGSKRGLLLAVSRRGMRDPFAGRTGSPLARLLDGLAGMTAAVATPEAMANSLAFLQIDLADPDFHQVALDGFAGQRAAIAALLASAVEVGELLATDTAALAQAIQTAYNGALITWGIYREGPIDAWLRAQLELVLAPHLAQAPR